MLSLNLGVQRNIRPEMLQMYDIEVYSPSKVKDKYSVYSHSS